MLNNNIRVVKNLKIHMYFSAVSQPHFSTQV